MTSALPPTAGPAALFNPEHVTSDQEQEFIVALKQGDSKEVFRLLTTAPASMRLGRIAPKRVVSHLPHFSSEEVFAITRLFVGCDCTNPDFFESLLQRVQEILASFKAVEIVDLLAITEKLEECQAKIPPNQVLVKFLQDLQLALYEHLQNEAPLLHKIREDLDQGVYPHSLSEGALKALLVLGNLKPKQSRTYKAQLESIQLKLLRDHRLSPVSLTNIAVYFSKCVKNQASKRNFYSDTGHKTIASRLQNDVHALTLSQRSDIVKSCAKGRIGDRRLLRTFARKLSQQEVRDVLPNFHDILTHLKSYAELGYPNQNIFAVAYQMIVVAGVSLPKDSTLDTLYATIVWGANPGTISARRIKQLFLAISPHVEPAACDAWMRYELAQRFSRILFPNPSLPALTGKAIEQLEKEKVSLKGVVSSSQQAIVNFLVGEGEEVECEARVEGYPYPLDILLRKRKLIIELDGPHHFDVSGENRLGKEYLKDFLLQHADWNIIHIQWKKKKSIDLTELLHKVKSYPLIT